MSKTYKDQRKYETSKFWDRYWEKKLANGRPLYSVTSLEDPRQDLQAYISKSDCFTHSQQFFTDYSSAPSWWTRLYSNLPKKRETKRLLKLAAQDPENADSLIFPTARKPFEYYW